MNILTIDTSFNLAVGIYDSASGESHFKYVDDATVHVERLACEIRDLCKETGISLNEMSKVAVGVGPAPYTGIRVGIATAKQIAFALNVECIGLSSTDIEAFALAKQMSDGQTCLIANNARRNQVYYGVYEKANGALKRIKGLDIEKPRNIVDLIKSEDIKTDFVCSTAFDKYAEIFGELNAERCDTSFATGDFVKTMAEMSKDDKYIKETKPLYLRRPDVF